MKGQKLEEYQSKKAEVIAKFEKEFFTANYLQDPMLRTIVEHLIRGADPYQIIEELITNRKELMEKYLWHIEHSMPINKVRP